MRPRPFGWLRWAALVTLVPIAVACKSARAGYPTPGKIRLKRREGSKHVAWCP